MTDHGNMHGAVHFYNYAQAAQVKPILGYEAYVVPGHGTRRDKKPGVSGEKGIFHLTLLARDFEGYQNLCRLSSRGYTEGYYYKPRIDHELLEEHSRGVIAFSGCLGSEVQQLLMQGREAEAKARLLWYRDLFGENYYIEIQDHGLPEQKRNNPILKAWADELGIGMVATNDGHYVKKSDATAHETLLAIQTKAVMADENRFKFPCDEFYVKTLEEMQTALPPSEWGEQIFDNSANIADLCNVELPVGKKRVYQMPALPIPEGRTMAEELRVQTYAGSLKRYPHHVTEALLREYAVRSLAALEMGERERVLSRIDGCDARSCDLDTLLTLIAFLGSEWEARGKAAGEKYTPYPALEVMERAAESGPLPDYACTDWQRSKGEASDTAIQLDPGSEAETTCRAHHIHALVLLRRAEYELSVINNMGFPDYLLIVADYINWAKDHGISVGPGRGSGAGSIVCYAIRITNLDPLEFDLLFERFLNPDRISMPDLDIDFNDARRVEVIDYVQKKYGEDKVAQIATFGTMASKACLKDVARVMGLEYAKVDKVSKLIPIKFGKSFHPGAGPRRRAGHSATAGRGPATARSLRICPATRRADPPRLGPRGGRGHRQGQADRPGAGDARHLRHRHGLPVRHESGRGHRPDQDGLPGPAHPVVSGRGQADSARISGRLQDAGRRFRHDSLRRRPDLRDAQPGRYQGRVSAGRSGHCRRLAPPQAAPIGRHHRALGALPPRPDGKHSDLCAPSPRPGDGGLRARRLSQLGAVAREDLIGNLRHSGVPGTDHADRLGSGRVQPGRGRSAAPGDGQERHGGDGQAA